MDPVAIARWQFGITTVYHFLFVPITIAMSMLVAVLQTIWVRTGKEQYLRLTKFFGKLFLINFALGVVTGIVQEFQFGMNWSEYSRFVGDVFGAPLALEALIAFFLESTFLGLWIFGWDKLPKKIHLACIYAAAIGTMLSSIFILAANSWMQHPVGAVIDEQTGRARLDGVDGFLRVLANPILWTTVVHVISSAFLVAGAVVLGVSAWWMTRAARAGQDYEARRLWRRLTRLGAAVMIAAGVLTAGSGHVQGQLVVAEQPAKMAAAEMLCQTQRGAGFTVAAFGSCRDGSAVHLITVPRVYSFMAANDPDAEVMGLNDAQAMYERAYGGGVDYTPDETATFWSFRLMIGLGMASAGIGAAALWLTRSGRLVASARLGAAALWTMWLPFAACSFGWIFTEIGRQPWAVAPNLADPASQVRMLTADGVSTVVSPAAVLASMIVFTLLYAALGAVWYLLLRRYIREGVRTPAGEDAATTGDGAAAPVLSFEY